jgi:threonine dehydrogenase-like Zn-dependent dehydrogenase
MKALRKTRAAAGLEFVDVAVPEARSPDEVLVRVTATGICGSDLHVDRWTPSYAFMAGSLPVTIGHEFVGLATSGATMGRRVVVRPSVTCGTCAACATDNFDACQRRAGIGMTRDGAFAPWVRVPQRNCVPVPEGLSDELAALTEPLSISMQALRVAGDVAGQRVLVLGPGTIGQGIAVLARRAGAAQVVVSGFDDAARFDALRRMGFDALVDVSKGSLAELTAPYMDGAPFDVVIEATGVPETITDALALLRRNGVVVVTGIHSRPLQLDLTTLVRKQQQLRGSFRPPESDWPRVLALMAEVGDELMPMVSHTLPLSQAMEGFALAHGKQASKVLLMPEHDDARRSAR